jgi:hypothetical protein
MNNSIENKLYTVREVTSFIEEGKLLTLAGTEENLSQLPAGSWIGGTIPYFMDYETCQFNNEKVFVNDLTDIAESYIIKEYDENNIEELIKDSFENGFTFIVIPAFQPVHQKYALKAPEIKNIYVNPVVGWITGKELNSEDIPKTFNGERVQSYPNKALAMHVKLADDKLARLDIVNIFKENQESVDIQFIEDGFSASRCLIDGVEKDFVQHLEENSIDTKLPIIANYSGARINISFKEIDKVNNIVHFYAPVFKGVVYKFSQLSSDYVLSFKNEVPKIDTKVAFSCNCILNYLYGELEGKKIKGMNGPITFGEIGYILLNQTMTYLAVE